MKIFFHPSVEKFIKNVDQDSGAEIYSSIELLEIYGNNLPMPHAKPIGDGLWELRIVCKHAFRVLYGFHKNAIILLLALKKQKSALSSKDIKIAKKRLDECCKI